jgi:hypothetical protein
MASRYECSLMRESFAGSTHDSGNGKPPRQKCRGCGGRFTTYTGQWGVFVWRGDGRYYADNAISLHERERDAQRSADREPERELVVRWVSG